jgi:hypothetical protein
MRAFAEAWLVEEFVQQAAAQFLDAPKSPTERERYASRRSSMAGAEGAFATWPA